MRNDELHQSASARLHRTTLLPSHTLEYFQRWLENYESSVHLAHQLLCSTLEPRDGRVRGMNGNLAVIARGPSPADRRDNAAALCIDDNLLARPKGP